MQDKRETKQQLLQHPGAIGEQFNSRVGKLKIQRKSEAVSAAKKKLFIPFFNGNLNYKTVIVDVIMITECTVRINAIPKSAVISLYDI